MRYIQNAYYWLVESFSRLIGDINTAHYYANKREDNR
jgi:hypothetical protein